MKELNRIMQQFWWGQKEKEKKIHWCSWHKMGFAKEAGGLGFRNLENLNIVVLAKQGWRLTQHPNSLAARVLLAKYYPEGEFCKVGLGRRPSLI